MNEAYLQSNTTASGDEVYTPFYAVEPLLKYIPKDWVIWLPFDEEWSAFYQLFTENGYKVIRSCLSEGKDFFLYEPDEHYDIIVSNPPFSLKDAILERLYQLEKPFCILLPANSIHGQSRFRLFKKGLELLILDKRVNYHTWGDMQHYKEGNHFGSIYFCRNLLPSQIEFAELTPYQRALSNENIDTSDMLGYEQLTLF